MSQKELHRRWCRRLAALQKTIGTLFEECRNTGGAETIHDLRVAIRRARLYAQVGRPLLRKGALKRIDTWARMVNDLVGPVRDCDVCMAWLAARSDSLEAIQLIHAERVRLWEVAVSVLKRRKSDQRGGMVPRKNEKDAPQKLGQRYRKELKRITGTVVDAVPHTARMQADELHDLRRGLRRWRYLRELSLSRRAQSTDPLLIWLVKVQDALGESQNLQMAIALFQKHSEWQDGPRFVDRARSEQRGWIERARQELLKMPSPCLRGE
jgi:CHAD domain-containing protein